MGNIHHRFSSVVHAAYIASFHKKDVDRTTSDEKENRKLRQWPLMKLGQSQFESKARGDSLNKSTHARSMSRKEHQSAENSQLASLCVIGVLRAV
jgi:hypothetical protein